MSESRSSKACIPMAVAKSGLCRRYAPSRLSRAVRVDGTRRRSSSTSSRSSPPPHLAKAGLLVVRDTLEDLQGRGPFVPARLQRGRVPRQVDRPLAEGQVFVPRLAGSPVIVVDVR